MVLADARASCGVGPLQVVEKLAPEYLRQRPDGKEESAARVGPAPALRGERSSRDEAVQVHVVAEPLVPGVQDRGEAELASEPVPRVAAAERKRMLKTVRSLARAGRLSSCGSVKTAWK